MTLRMNLVSLLTAVYRLMLGLLVVMIVGLVSGAVLVGLTLLINFLFGPVIYV